MMVLRVLLPLAYFAACSAGSPCFRGATNNTTFSVHRVVLACGKVRLRRNTLRTYISTYVTGAPQQFRWKKCRTTESTIFRVEFEQFLLLRGELSLFWLLTEPCSSAASPSGHAPLAVCRVHQVPVWTTFFRPGGHVPLRRTLVHGLAELVYSS